MESLAHGSPQSTSPFVAAFDGAKVIRLQEKRWGGVGVHVKEQRFTTPFEVDLRSEYSRFSVVLDLAGAQPEARESRARPVHLEGHTIHQMNFSPADSPIWACAHDTKFFRTMSMFFKAGDIDYLVDEKINPNSLLTPKLMFFDPSLLYIAKLMEIAFDAADMVDDIYVETLTLAFLLRLSTMDGARCESSARGGLTAYQLRQVTEYLNEHLAEGASLQELASITGLSRSYFSRAFRESAGMPAHQWLLQKRIQKSKQYLLSADLSVAQVALAVGFSDQAHFSKMFSRVVGSSPASWRRARAN